MADMPEVDALPARLTPARLEANYATGYWRDELVGQTLARNAAERGAALAVVDSDRRISWEELYKLSLRCAHGLRCAGLKPRDAVALQLPNWLEYLVCYYGIQLANGIVVQPGVDWREHETRYALGLGPARMHIVPDQFGDFDFQDMATRLRGEMPSLTHTWVARGPARDGCHSLDALLAGPDPDPSAVDALMADLPSADRVVRLVFTSGTTGLPKAIMHTNNTIAHSSRTLIGAFDLHADDVLFSYVPLSTNYGVIMGLNLHIDTGGTLVLMDRFSASGALAQIDAEQVTFLPGTPTAFIAMLNSPALATARLGSLRMMISAGASFPVQAIKELRAALPAPFVESFGMNEFGMGFWCQLHDDPREVDGSIGKPIPGLEARIDGASREGSGEVGELLIRSAGMCTGYYNNPGANEDAWGDEGWFRSGDLASQDANGNFRIVGRSKDVIIRGGANVSPRELEELLSTEPRVREVSVVGVPDDYYGETVCACVILKPHTAMTLEEVREFLGRKLAAYKLPTHLVIVSQFPLNAMGKVVKARLLEQIGPQLSA